MTRRLFAFLLAVIGYGLIVSGVAQIHEPSALIVAGVLLLVGLFGIDVALDSDVE